MYAVRYVMQKTASGLFPRIVSGLFQFVYGCLWLLSGYFPVADSLLSRNLLTLTGCRQTADERLTDAKLIKRIHLIFFLYIFASYLGRSYAV